SGLHAGDRAEQERDTGAAAERGSLGNGEWGTGGDRSYRDGWPHGAAAFARAERNAVIGGGRQENFLLPPAAYWWFYFRLMFTELVFCPSIEQTTGTVPLPLKLDGIGISSWSSPANSGVAPAKSSAPALRPPIVH